MANTSIPINTNPTSDPQYTGGEVVLPSDDSVIDINPINENAEALAEAVNQLFWDVNQGSGGGTNAQVEINRQNIGAPAGTVLGTNLQTQVTNLGNRVSTTEGNINSLSSNVNALSGTVGSHTTSINSLDNRVGTAESNITADETQIGNIKSAVGIDNSGALTPTVAGTLAKQVADNSSGIATLSQQVGANTIGTTSDASSEATVYGYVNGVKDTADANLATLETLGGGTVPTQSLDTLITAEVNNALSGYTPTIQPGQIGNAELASGAVTSDKIGNKEVKTVNIDDSAVGSAQIANGAVGTTQLAQNAVTYNNLDSSLQSAIDSIPTIFISEKDTYHYATAGNAVVCDVCYKIYSDGSVEIFIQGTSTYTVTAGTAISDGTISINLAELGITASSVSFANAHTESGSMVVKVGAGAQGPVLSYKQALSIVSNNLTLTYTISLPATSLTYDVDSFYVNICGNGITVTNPNT